MEVGDVSLVASSGAVLSTSEKAALQSSVPLLKKQYRFGSVKLFGKIKGKTSDYLIAMGEESTGTKKYFFSLDAVTWAQLPELTAETKALCAKLPAGLPFTGDISHAITLEAPEPAEDEEPPEPPTVTEEVRLAVAVETIEMECALAPTGALISSLADGHLKANPNYKGIDLTAAKSLSSYVFMNCQTPTSVLAGVAPADRLSSLASAESAVPAGSLCTRYDEATGAVQVRSLLWPGHVAFVKPGTPVHGYCYFGNAVKNTDIAFMLP